MIAILDEFQAKLITKLSRLAERMVYFLWNFLLCVLLYIKLDIGLVTYIRASMQGVGHIVKKTVSSFIHASNHSEDKQSLGDFFPSA